MIDFTRSNKYWSKYVITVESHYFNMLATEGQCSDLKFADNLTIPDTFTTMSAHIAQTVHNSSELALSGITNWHAVDKL